MKYLFETEVDVKETIRHSLVIEADNEEKATELLTNVFHEDIRPTLKILDVREVSDEEIADLKEKFENRSDDNVIDVGTEEKVIH